MKINVPAYADEQLKAAIQSFNDASTASYAQEAEAEKERTAAAQVIASKEGDTAAALKAMKDAEEKKRSVIVARPRLSDALPDIAAKWEACRSAEIAKHVRLADERRQHLLDICQRENLQPVSEVLKCCPLLAQRVLASINMDALRFDPLQTWADGVSAAAFEASGVPMPSPVIVRRGRPGGLATA